MGFEIVPALDVAGGRLARIVGAGVEPVEAFGGDPSAAAEAFAAAGARRLHVVDLDLARSGRPGNLETVRAVAGLGVPVQASGGVSAREQAEALLSAGADRVVLGSAALADRAATEALVVELAERLVVAIEAEGTTIRPRGARLELPLRETLGWLAGLPVRRFLFVGVGRVGALRGPDLAGVRGLARRTGRPVLASGGIRGLEDLRALAALDGTVEGAVVGRALYEAAFTLAEALAAVGSGPRAPGPA